MFHCNMIFLKNKLTQVTRNTANAIKNIITNTVIGFKSAVIKTYFSDQ